MSECRQRCERNATTGNITAGHSRGTGAVYTVWELSDEMLRERSKLGGNPGRGIPKRKAEGDTYEQV